MKALILAIAVVISMGLVQCGSESYSHNANTLPDNAKNLISQNFASAISVVKEESNTFGQKEYEVVLADGTEVTLNGHGEWKNIETPNNHAVPRALVPKPVTEYVSQNHAGASIVGIEKDKKGYEVTLSNGVEIEFNQDGGFLKYDH